MNSSRVAEPFSCETTIWTNVSLVMTLLRSFSQVQRHRSRECVFAYLMRWLERIDGMADVVVIEFCLLNQDKPVPHIEAIGVAFP